MGDLFAGIGGPIIYDGNGITIPAWDSAGEPVPRLDRNGVPIIQQPPAEEAPGIPVVSSRLMIDPAFAGPVCQFWDGTREAATPNPAALFGFSCRPEPYWGLMFEPVCLKPSGVDKAGGSWDTVGNVTCPANSQPQYTVPLPHAPNGGMTLLADDHGNFPPGNSGPLKGVVNPEQSFTYGCAVDPASGHLWTTDFYTNRVNDFTGTGAAPQTTIDLSGLTLGPTCGQGNFNTLGGCGGVGPILFVNQAEGGASTDLFVGTTIGTNKIFRYSMAGIGPASVPDQFQVPMGATGLDLAADRETMFYTSGDSFIRVFNITKAGGAQQPLRATALGAKLIAAGLQLVDVNDQPATDPDALFGRIPYTRRGFNQALGNEQISQVHLLPPGDPLKFGVDPLTGQPTLIKTGILIAQNGDNYDVNVVDLTPADPSRGFPDLRAQNRSGYVRDLRDVDFLPGLTDFHSLDITPDGRSFWTAALLNGTTPQVLKFHIPTRTLEVVKNAPAGTAIINSLCVATGYAAGATQPDCSLHPESALCKPLPAVCSIDSLDPDCISPGKPIIQSKMPDQMNLEGDAVHAQAVVATDPVGGPLGYAQSGLPPGLHLDPDTGFVSGQIDANGGGNYHVIVTVTNAIGSSAASFNWSVIEWNVAPQFEAAVVPPSLPHGLPVSIQLSARDLDSCDDVFFVLTSDSGPLPTGLTISDGPHESCANTGRVYTATIAGTPTTLGRFTFTIWAKDNWEEADQDPGVNVRQRGTAASQLRTFTIDVIDMTPPAIANMPASQTLEATGPDGAVATFSLPTASDLLDPAPSVSCNPASGATFSLGVTTVTCTATDHASPTPNSATRSFTVTVTDLTKPTIDSHASLTVEATGPAGAVVNYTPPATHDIVDGTGTAVCAPAPGATFPLGTTTVTCSKTDAHGNSATNTTFLVTVTVNNQLPVCTAAQPSVAELWSPNHQFVTVSILKVTDPNLKPLNIAITGVLQDEPTNGLGDGDTPIDAVINGLTVQLRAERSGAGDGRVYVVAFTATNTIGGSCSGTVNVSVPHDQGSKGPAVDSLVRYNSLLAGVADESKKN